MDSQWCFSVFLATWAIIATLTTLRAFSQLELKKIENNFLRVQHDRDVIRSYDQDYKIDELYKRTEENMSASHRMN